MSVKLLIINRKKGVVESFWHVISSVIKFEIEKKSVIDFFKISITFNEFYFSIHKNYKIWLNFWTWTYFFPIFFLGKLI